MYWLIKYDKISNGDSFSIIFDGYWECVDSGNDADTETREILALDVTALNETSLDITVKCKENYLPIVFTLNLEFSNADYNRDPNEYGLNINKKLPGIAICFQANEASPIIPNCEYY